MKRILITYSDENMKFSRKLLKFQARMINIFDKIIIYTPESLPSYIKESPLMKYKKGGGYWAWKPCIIWETLQKINDDDILCYVDAGCSLFRGEDWIYYFELMNKYNVLCFQYQDNISEWKKFGETSTQIRYWTKKNTLLFFDQYLGSTSYRSFNKIFAAVLFCKGKHNKFIKDWLDITLKYPCLITDPNNKEKKDQYSFFSGIHRHDQSIITPLAYLYANKEVCILPEKFDVSMRTGIIVATRYRITSKKNYYQLMFYYFIHFWKNKKWYKQIKNIYRIIRK